MLWLITWDPSQPEATRPLAIQKDGTWYTYGWDLTKNICELYSSNGYIITSYSYAPFGAVTTTGHVTQPIQWSSEMFDIELMLNYYNYRFYNEKIGRMIVMDYIERMNPYDFLNNDSIGSYDYLGLWKDLGNHRWCAENGDTLQSLASKYQASEKDSDCLWPENDSKSYYPSVRVNDIYDASNLCIGCGGKVLNYETFKDFMARHARVYGLISGDETSASLTNLKLNFVPGKEIANKLKDESGEGATPIVRLIIAGHGVVNPKTKKTVGIGSGKNYFSPSKWLKENEEKQTYERAKSRKGPKRCWFRRDSYVKFIGCNTNLLAKTFAEKVLRRNSMAEGTNHSIRHIKPGNTLEYKEDTEWITSSPADTSVTWQPHHGIL